MGGGGGGGPQRDLKFDHQQSLALFLFFSNLLEQELPAL